MDTASWIAVFLAVFVAVMAGISTKRKKGEERDRSRR